MRYLFLAFMSLGMAEPLKVEVKAQAAVLMNADTGAILYEKEGYTSAYPGSTTKIATALYVLDEKKVDLNQKVKVSEEAIKYHPSKVKPDDIPSHRLGKDGTRMWLAKSEVLRVEDLMYGLMLISGNDAANAVAEAVSGTIPKFMEELNDYLKRIGCNHTFFNNPHGYHHSQHKTTPYDLCLMMKKGLENPIFCKFIRTESVTIPKTNGSPPRELKQSNFFMRQDKKSYYPKALGGKTGRTEKGGWCLVSAAEQDGRKLIACVFGCSTMAARFAETRKLFEAAFAEKRVEKILVPNYQTFEKQLLGAKTPLKATLRGDVKLTFFPSEEPKVKALVYWDPPSFPIRKGDRVGEVRVVDDAGEILTSESLIATEEVVVTFWHRFKRLF
jgi:D-alanyl-D-alanine carboxypeptidase (penicillin-binding protein 5/6)